MGGGKTEFDDILIKHGIIKDPEAEEAKEEQHIYTLADKSDSDDQESDSDPYFDQYKQKRIAELQANQVYELGRSDFVKQVTEASFLNPVILLLYQSSSPDCVLLKHEMARIAGAYQTVRFVEMVATRCIPDYPDALVPTVLYYKDGVVVQQVTKAKPSGLRLFLDTCLEHSRISASVGSEDAHPADSDDE